MKTFTPSSKQINSNKKKSIEFQLIKRILHETTVSMDVLCIGTSTEIQQHR